MNHSRADYTDSGGGTHNLGEAGFRLGRLEGLLLPQYGPKRYLLAISERLKVDDEAVDALAGPVLRFKEIPNAPELLGLLERMVTAGAGP